MMQRRRVLAAAVVCAAISSPEAASVGSTQCDGSIPGHDPWADAVRCATLSSIAYCINDIESWSCPLCKTAAVDGVKPVVTLYNESTDTRGYVAVDHGAGVVYVVFRGTEDLANWITNLQAFGRADFQLPLCGGVNNPTMVGVLVHPGFYKAYESVREQIADALAQVAKAGGQDYHVVVSGHSLGGALSTLAGLDLGCGHPFNTNKVNIVNFGSPRLGDKTFASLFKTAFAQNISLARFTHWRDIVPHLPPEWLNYHHGSIEYFLHESWQPNCTIVECNGSGEDKLCSDQFDVYDVNDHLHYVGVHQGHDAC